MTSYLPEKEEIIGNMLCSAIDLAISGDEYDWCGTYHGLRLAAAYLHRRHGVPIEDLHKVIPSTFDVVPYEFHRNINAVYIDDKERTIYVVANWIITEKEELDAHLMNVCSCFRSMMRSDAYYDYTEMLPSVDEAMSKGYKVSFKIFVPVLYVPIVKQCGSAIEYIRSRGQDIEMILPSKMSEYLGLRFDAEENHIDISWGEA